MERLREKDLSALLDFLRDAYALRDLDAFRTHVVCALPTLIRSEITSFHEMDPDKRWFADVIDPEPPNLQGLKEAWGLFVPEHPVLGHEARAAAGTSLKFTDFLTLRQFRQLGIHANVHRSLRVDRVMGFTFPITRSARAWIAVHRSGVDFSERERLLLDLLRPHLRQAFWNAHEVTRLRQTLGGAGQVLERITPGLIVLTPDARIQQATLQARRWLAQYWDRSRPSGRLPDSLERWVHAQLARLAAAGDAPTPPTPLTLEREMNRLVIRLLCDARGALLLLEEQPTTSDPAPLQAFGLTKREAEILYWVAQGKTNPEIALILGLSHRTVGKHLERIFPKLGVETRTAAAARALESLRRPAPEAAGRPAQRTVRAI